MILQELGTGATPDVPRTKTPTRSRIYYYKDDKLFNAGDIISSSSQKTLNTPGNSNKTNILSFIDKFRPTGYSKFEDLIHLYTTSEEINSWHSYDKIYEVTPDKIISTDIRWLMQLETWVVMLKSTSFRHCFGQNLDNKWLSFINNKIKTIVVHFWSGDIFDYENYNQSIDEKNINILNVMPGPLLSEFQLLLCNKIQIKREINEN